MYIDENDDLNICLRQESLLGFKSAILKYTTGFYLTGETNYKFVNQKFNLNQLLQIKTTFENQHSIDFYVIAISQKENMVKITVDNISKKDIILHYLEEYVENFDPQMVSISVGKMIKSMNFAYSGLELRYRTKFLFFWTTQWYGTIGFNATRNGTKGIVTNQHVAPEGHLMWDHNNNVVGTSNMAVRDGIVDASFVPFADQNVWDNTNAIREAGDNDNVDDGYIVSYMPAFEGTRYKSYGATTGSLYGSVTNAYASINVTYSDGVIPFTDIIQTNIPIQGGDSGGPLVWWHPRSMSKDLVGINFAGDGTTSYAIKIENIVEALDIDVIAYY
jgi:hypothetical protein